MRLALWYHKCTGLRSAYFIVPKGLIGMEKQKLQIQRMRARRKRKIRRMTSAVLILCTLIALIFFSIQGLNHLFSQGVLSSLHNQTANSRAESGDLLTALHNAAKSDSRVASIVDNIGAYPNDLLVLLIRNPETADFVLHYPQQKNSTQAVFITQAEKGKGVPLLLQWDERWGYARYGDSIIALTGCGPTCLSMVVIGITGDVSANPKKVSQFSESRGYVVSGSGTDWELFTNGAKSYGLEAKELPLSESAIIDEIENGHPVICGMKPGDFTSTGHFIVLCGYQNGSFSVHDPNSKERSARGWDYQTLQGQIKVLWAYSKRGIK